MRVTSQVSGAARRAALALLLVCAVFVIRSLWALHVSFINDDFLFLDHARHTSFLGLWGMDDALGNAYRPITRNLDFWLGLKLFGTHPLPYHVVNLAIGVLGVVLFYFVLDAMLARAQVARHDATALRRKTKQAPRTAAAAAAPAHAHAPALLGALLFALHPASGTPLAWVCDVQDVLSLTLALGAVLAHLHRRRIVYPLLLAAAVLSKETAVLVPGVLWLFDLLVERTSLGTATRRQAGAITFLALWAIGDQWLPWHGLGRAVHANEPGHHTAFGRADLARFALTLRTLVLVEPTQGFEWWYGALSTVGTVACAAGALTLAARLPWPRRPSGSLYVVAAAWALSGIVPYLAVTSHFTYYAWYPALGGVLATAGALTAIAQRRRHASAATASALCAVLIVSAGRVHETREFDARAVERASSFLWNFKSDLQGLHPTLPDSSISYFKNLPHYVGFQIGSGAAVRVWYGNPTLASYFMTSYRPTPTRPSFFFVCDSTGHMIEVVRGLPDPHLAHPSPIYAEALNDLGAQLAEAGETAAATVEWRKALRVRPDNEAALANLGGQLVGQARYADAAPYLRRAVQLAPDDLDAALDLAIAEASLGDLAAARARLQRIVDAAPASDDGQRAAALLARLGGTRAGPP